MRVLAFEPFDDGSHAAVRRSVEARSRHAWRWLTRPGRAWKWRMRTAAIELAEDARRTGALEPAPDALVVSSLMSAADLRALLPADARQVPLVLWMHENQVEYPRRGGDPDDDAGAERDLHFALTNLTSLLAADLVLWNSAWNRESFLAGLGPILSRAPDGRFEGIEDRIRGRSVVAWPPVEPPPIERDRPARARRGDPGEPPLRIVWPHRWEHDKGPDGLLAAMDALAGTIDARWVILGQRYRRCPAVFETIEARHGDRIEHMGHVEDRAAYWRRLASSDWVCSTARHEFFGIAVVEAIMAGCLPWLPERLSYPELLPAVARGRSPLEPPEDPAAVVAACRRHLRPALADRAVARIDDVLEDLSGR